jgi:predicted transcriptional regulator
MKMSLTVKLDEDIVRFLDAISRNSRLSRGHLVREALRSHYGLDSGHALAAALANAGAPMVNGQGADG